MTPPLPWPVKRAADEYEDHMKEVLKKAPNTIRGARQALNRFIEKQPDTLTTHDFTADLFKDYAGVAFVKLADKTENLQIGHLKRWLQWLAEEDRLGKDKAPWRKLVTIKKPKSARKKGFIRKSGTLEALVEAARDWHERDAYFIQASYYFARRGGEMIVMKVGDIDFTPRPKAKHGIFGFEDIKNRGEREYLPIPEPFAEPLKDWLKIYEELLPDEPDGSRRKLHPDDYLFPALKPGSGKSVKGMRRPMVLRPRLQFPYHSAAETYRRAFRVAGIMRPLGLLTHGTRRGFLDDLINAAAAAGRADGIRLAKTYASHDTEATTELYTDHSRDRDTVGEAFGQIFDNEAPETAEVPERAATVHSLDELRKRRLKAV